MVLICRTLINRGDWWVWEVIMKCPECGRSDCTEIQISLKEESSVKFFSCRGCEAKWWEHGGETIELDEVLNLTSTKRT